MHFNLNLNVLYSVEEKFKINNLKLIAHKYKQFYLFEFVKFSIKNSVQSFVWQATKSNITSISGEFGRVSFYLYNEEETFKFTRSVVVCENQKKVYILKRHYPSFKDICFDNIIDKFCELSLKYFYDLEWKLDIEIRQSQIQLINFNLNLKAYYDIYGILNFKITDHEKLLPYKFLNLKLLNLKKYIYNIEIIKTYPRLIYFSFIENEKSVSFKSNVVIKSNIIFIGDVLDCTPKIYRESFNEFISHLILVSHNVG